MHEHNVTKRWSRLDQVFLTTHSSETLITCNTVPEERGINIDHLPIHIKLSLEVAITVAEPSHNFRNMNWEEFRSELKTQLDNTPSPAHISNQVQLDKCCEELIKALQEAIWVEVPMLEITPKSKHWWSKELTQLCPRANKLGRAMYKLRNVPDYSVYKEHKEAKNKYQNMLKTTKQ